MKPEAEPSNLVTLWTTMENLKLMMQLLDILVPKGINSRYVI
jgi:hypothetical protein